MSKFEVLAIVGVMGIFGVIAGVAVLNARERVRDTARLSQIRDVQEGLESYFTDHSAYPATSEQIALGQSTSLCLSNDGFACTVAPENAYLDVVPSPPASGLKGKSSCSGIANAYCYESDAAGYRLQFELESGNALLQLTKGVNCANETKLLPGACAAYSH